MTRLTPILFLTLASLALSACSGDDDGFTLGATVTIATVGGDGASCELEDAQLRQYFVRSTPGPVTLAQDAGVVQVICRKIGYGVGAARFGPDGAAPMRRDTGFFDDVLSVFGFDDAPMMTGSGPYPATVIVDLRPTTNVRRANGASLMGSSLGQQVWGAEMRAGAPPSRDFGTVPPAPPPPTSLRAGAPAPSLSAPPPVQPGGSLVRPDGSSQVANAFPRQRGVNAPPLIPIQAPGAGLSAAPSQATAPRQASLGDYAVQVGAFAEMANAELMVRALETRGYPAELSTVTDRRGRKWVRVRFGAYPDRRTANRAAQDFRASERMAAMVVSKETTAF